MNGSKALKRNDDVLPKSGETTQNGAAEYLWLSSGRGGHGALPKSGNGTAEYLWLSSNRDSRGNRGALPKSGKATDPSAPDLLNTSAGHNIKRVIAELEKRRAELFSLARAAEAIAQTAEEKREQAEHRLKQETNQRLVAEQRLRELEEYRLRQLQAVKNEGVKTIKTALAHAGARLKEANGRIKAAENYAKSLALALAEANRKRAKAEAIARAAEEKAHRIKAFFPGSEAAAHEATERYLLFGFLIFANRRAEAVAGAKPRKDTKLPNSWREFGEFAQKIAKSLDKMLISVFRQTSTPSRPRPLARQSSNLPDIPR
ncbi:MAG: hypothetical protein ACREBD_19840 [Blastocatellia bacterium]